MKTVRHLDDILVSQGRYVASVEEIESLIGSSPNISARLARLRGQRRLVSAAKGLYLVIPPEYRTWGGLPGDWFIDELMRYLGRQYYVGLLSAAAIHGASHQSPQTFQVVVDRRVRARVVGRVMLQCFSTRTMATAIQRQGIERRTSHTGGYNVSTPELTAIDLVAQVANVGGLENVATVFTELEGISGPRLAALAEGRPQSIIRRLGWLLDRFGQAIDLDPLATLIDRDPEHPTPLDPDTLARGTPHPRWNVLENVAIEPDL